MPGCGQRAAHRDEQLARPRDDAWLLIEWPEGEAEPRKYWLATVPEDMAFADLVDLAKLRWRIEHDYHALKQEIGLGHHEGTAGEPSTTTPPCASRPTAS